MFTVITRVSNKIFLERNLFVRDAVDNPVGTARIVFASS
jgi:hypothetical protein